ncbi:MAG: histidinol-phosphate transaminase [Candidatus Hydrogenedentes bacterium]|nr:histidinol-phosphate transaminase [Candidatus Hydrogenedentota bacterium]
MSRYCTNRLKGIEGYIPGEQPQEQSVIKLNTNENPYPPTEKILGFLKNISLENLRKYPDPLSIELRKKIAETYDLPSHEWVIVGNGMDDIISIVIRTFIDFGEIISATYPTYTLYEVLAKIHGYDFIYHELDDNFELHPPFLWGKSKLIFITHPNAPSGVPVHPVVMEKVCNEKDKLIFIDEAYAEFSEFNYLRWVLKYSNLIVGRTFSKSFSLAGIRLGFAVANPELTRDMLKVKDSYNVNYITQMIGILALEDIEYSNSNIKKIKSTRESLRNSLINLGFTVPNSHSNFLLAIWEKENPKAQEIYIRLKEKNIFVRYFPQRRLENAIRITIGTEEQSKTLIEALKDILSR